jgi:hypothetical protein
MLLELIAEDKKVVIVVDGMIDCNFVINHTNYLILNFTGK